MLSREMINGERAARGKYGRGLILPEKYKPIKPALSFRHGRGRELPRAKPARLFSR